MNKQNENKIEWCDATINPVVGCPRGCEYCYAKRMNDRFGIIEDFSNPQFFPERLKALYNKIPKAIFMNSMSDFALWEETTQEEVYRECYINPQHRYLFLTKEYDFEPSNCPTIYYGLTIVTNADVYKSHTGNFDFYSIEPIHEKIQLTNIESFKLKAVIIGAETGIRRGKVIPRKEWIDDIVRQCDAHGIAVFIKNSLRGIMGKDFRTDKLPWEVSL